MYENQFCTGPGSGTQLVGACDGDLGGPLVVRKGDTDIQIGVAIWVPFPCDSVTVFHKVSAFIDFINKYISDED